MNLEASNLEANRMELEPRWLLCMNCLRGGGQAGCAEADRLAQLYRRIEENPEIHITLVGAFDETGARTGRFDAQTPAQRRKDLDVLQRLGLCFGDTRCARDLFRRTSLHIQTLEGICRYPENPYGKWPECGLSGGEFYIKGNQPLPDAQSPRDMAAQKACSCRALAGADKIVIRPHHLLCIVCFAGRDGNDQPLPEDNLYEAWVKIRENPGLPVTLVEGPGACCICPPCHSYIPARGLCVAACHLRDRKKDLDTFVALGLNPGDTRSARELYARILERISDVRAICGYETNTSDEWTSCGGTDSYAKGLPYFKALQ